MPTASRNPLTPLAAFAVALVPLVLALAACGSSEGSDATRTSAAPAASSFPSPKGKTIDEIEADSGASDLVVVPTVQLFESGLNRYAFGLFTVERETVTDAEVALYASDGKGDALGPYPATSQDLTTDAAFASISTTGDPDAATNLYTAEVELPRKGDWRITALIREEDGSFSYSRAIAPMVVGGPAAEQIPAVGEPAPKMHTPTVEDVGGDLTKIDTRQPPDTMHEVDYADALGEKPIVLTFATPALCTSRVCGPVVDIAEQVKNDRPGDATYIHMEIYEDNKPPNPNEQVRAFRLRTEPWLFVIDSDGKVAARMEGAFTEDELNAAIDGVS